MAAIPPNQSIKNALSAARIGTYETATTVAPTLDGALNLYVWNAKVSGAMLAPLHMCEVVIRNAVSEALTAEYGLRWPWSYAFEQSLPTSGKFNMREHLKSKRYLPTTGKIIPELNFVFWEKMFTLRFDAQIWVTHLNNVFPYLNPEWTLPKARGQIYDALFKVRALRNRIAHHEPIITRALADDFSRIENLIKYRCPITAGWMVLNQQALPLINTKPL